MCAPGFESPDKRQHERDSGEDADEQRAEPAVGEGIGDDVAERSDLSPGERRIDAQRIAEELLGRSCVEPRARGNRLKRIRHLVYQQEHRRLNVGIQTGAAHVGNDTHDFARDALPEPDPELPPYWVLARKNRAANASLTITTGGMSAGRDR